MAFEVHISQKQAGDRTGDVYELTDAAGTVRAEVWPQWGFNCLRWQVRQEDGRWTDIIFTMPDWESNPVPTRSGHPILFPFPGRLRNGKLNFEGQEYQLPLNDSTKQHAIHGFTPRNPWRVIEWNADDDSAFVTGQFNLAKDLPAALPTWPSDFNLTVTYRLFRNKLRVTARVENVGDKPLPFGIGYHPYFRLPGVNDVNINDHVLQANVSELWEAENNLPTGKCVPLPQKLDFRDSKPIGSTELDHVYTSIPTDSSRVAGMGELAVLSHPEAMGCVQFLISPSFRELVLFTPAHRHAIAIEPYTCSADASNLAARGIESGWKVIPVGSKWEESVEYRWVIAEL